MTMAGSGRWRLVMVLCLALLTVSCVLLAYLWIDRSISLAYLQASHEATAESRAQLAKIIDQEWRDLSEDDVLQRLQSNASKNPELSALVKRESTENLIWFGRTRFEFKDGRLIKVH